MRIREGGSGGEEEEEEEEEEKRDESSGTMVWDHLQSIIRSYPLVGREKDAIGLFWLRILPKGSEWCACFCAIGPMEQKTEARLAMQLGKRGPFQNRKMEVGWLDCWIENTGWPR